MLRVSKRDAAAHGRIWRFQLRPHGWGVTYNPLRLATTAYRNPSIVVDLSAGAAAMGAGPLQLDHDGVRLVSPWSDRDGIAMVRI